MITQILITGCTSGLGRAIALNFANQNCIVYAVGRRQALLEELAKESKKIKIKSYPRALSISSQHIY